MTLSKRYKKAAYDIQLKAPLLHTMFSLLVVSGVALVVSNFFSEVSWPRMSMHALALGLSVWALLTLRAGKYQLSSKVALVAIHSFLAILRILDGYSSPYALFMVAAILGAFITLSSLFITSRLIMYALTGISVLTFSYILFLGFYQGKILSGEESLAVQLIFPTIALTVILFSVSFIRNIFDKVLSQAMKQTEDTKNLSNQTDCLVENSILQMSGASVLLQNSQETAQSVLEITDNVSSISQGAISLGDRLLHSTESLQKLHTHVQNLGKVIQFQSERIGQSIDSTDSIVHSIDKMNQSLGSEKDSVSILQERSREGKTQIEQTTTAFSKVLEQLGNIRGMTTIISQIAAQTNLLAMNAAIEAAHAGDSGRGFAVVAGEIRNLASSSSNNAKKISKSLGNLVSAVEEANSAMENTGEAFSQIFSEVNEVHRTMESLNQGSKELKSSGQSIEDYSKEVLAATKEVESSVHSLEDGHRQIKEDFQSVGEFSTSLTSGLGEIRGGIEQISQSIQNINALSGNLMQTSESLKTEISDLKQKKLAVFGRDYLEGTCEDES